jgi:hypothetical protein
VWRNDPAWPVTGGATPAVWGDGRRNEEGMKLNHKKIASCPCGCAVRKNKRGRWVVVGEVNDECECGCAQLPHHMSCRCGRCDDCLHDDDLDIEELEEEAEASEEAEGRCIHCKHPRHVGECWVAAPYGQMLCSCFIRFPFEGRNHIISDSPFLVNGEEVESLVYFPPKGVPVIITATSSPVYVGGHQFEVWRGKSRPYVLKPRRSARVILVEERKATSYGEWEVTPF